MNYLKISRQLVCKMAVLLAFIGVKMLLPFVSGLSFINVDLSIGTGASLIVIVSILTVSILASIFIPRKQQNEETKTVESMK